ncbi:MAG: hypothetical protein RL217_2086 [Pseudomonadota bacterium]
MLTFMITGLVVASVLSWLAYYLWQQTVLRERFKLDDAKGYFLMSCIVIAFFNSAGLFYFGQVLGFDQADDSSTMMALGILLSIMATLLVLIFGLTKFHEPERY